MRWLFGESLCVRVTLPLGPVRVSWLVQWTPSNNPATLGPHFTVDLHTIKHFGIFWTGGGLIFRSSLHMYALSSQLASGIRGSIAICRPVARDGALSIMHKTNHEWSTMVMLFLALPHHAPPSPATPDNQPANSVQYLFFGLVVHGFGNTVFLLSTTSQPLTQLAKWMLNRRKDTPISKGPRKIQHKGLFKTSR